MQAAGAGDDILVGVTSYGPNLGCGTSGGLGVYTSLSYWDPWVADSLSLYNMAG